MKPSGTGKPMPIDVSNLAPAKQGCVTYLSSLSFQLEQTAVEMKRLAGEVNPSGTGKPMPN